MMVLRPSGGGEGFLRGSSGSCFSLERVSRNSSGSNSRGVSVEEKKKKKIGYRFLSVGCLVCVFAWTVVSA